MEQFNLKLLIENELYPIVLANSNDELAKINYDTVRKSINEFIGRYNKRLTIENIDFLTEYIWTIINKKRNVNNDKNLDEK